MNYQSLVQQVAGYFVPMAIAVKGPSLVEVSPLEIMAERPGIPLLRSSDGSKPCNVTCYYGVPFNPMIDSKKRKNGNPYYGWKTEMSWGINALREAKKPNKDPVPLPYSSERGGHKNQPNKTAPKEYLYYSRRR